MHEETVILREARTDDLDALIEAEYVVLRKHFEDRLAPLLVRRALRDADDRLPSSAVAVHVTMPAPAEGPEAPRARSLVARLSIKALMEAPGHRMYGRALNRIVLDAVFTSNARKAPPLRAGMDSAGGESRHPGIQAVNAD